MNVYLDSSALAKLALSEDGADDVLQLKEAADVVGSSRIGWVECHSAVRRVMKEIEQAPSLLNEALANLNRAWDGVLIIEADDGICAQAVDLISTFPLRGADAIHLSSALQLAGEMTGPTKFVCWDRQLARAAAGAGLDVVPALP